MPRTPASRFPAAPAAIAAILFAAAAPAAASEPTLAEGQPGPAALPAPAATSPMVAEVLADLQDHQERIAAVLGELATTADRGRALALQREVAALKREAEAGMLRIQAGHARRGGQVELAEGLEAAVRSLEAASPPDEGRTRDDAPAGR